MTTTTIQKWGNSQGVRLPKHLLDEVHLAENDVISIKADNGVLIIEKAEKLRKTIKELFADYHGDYEPQEIDFGEQAGKEVW